MSDDPVYLAQEANRIMTDPRLVAARDAVEAGIINDLRRLKPSREFDEQRQALCLKLQVIEDVWSQLRSVITTGQIAAKRSGV